MHSLKKILLPVLEYSEKTIDLSQIRTQHSNYVMYHAYMRFIFINFMCNFIYLFISRKISQTWSIDRSRQHHQMMNQRAQLLKKQITSHLLYHRCHPFTTQLYQPQYIHHHILHRISPDNQLQCRTINFSATTTLLFSSYAEFQWPALLNRRHINQPTNWFPGCQSYRPLAHTSSTPQQQCHREETWPDEQNAKYFRKKSGRHK